MPRRALLAAFLLPALLASLASCKKDYLYRVRGIVTIDGEPAQGIAVRVTSRGQFQGEASTGGDGRYEVEWTSEHSGIANVVVRLIEVPAGVVFESDSVFFNMIHGETGSITGADIVEVNFAGSSAIVQNTPPVASIVSPLDGQSYRAGHPIEFNGSATDAEDGSLSGSDLVWDSSIQEQLDTGRRFLTSGLVPGTHTITLTATDSEGLSGSASVTIHVDASNTPPVATITAPADGAQFDAGTSIDFSGSAMDAEDGVLSGSALVWGSNIDGQIGTGAAFTRNDLSIGAHTITLIATDAEGVSGSTNVGITVPDPNPTASISGRVTGNGNGVSGATLTLTGPVSRTTTSGSGGSYGFTMLPAGTYSISVSTSFSIDFPANPQTVTLGPGEAATVDFAGTY